MLLHARVTVGLNHAILNEGGRVIRSLLSGHLSAMGRGPVPRHCPKPRVPSVAQLFGFLAVFHVIWLIELILVLLQVQSHLSFVTIGSVFVDLLSRSCWCSKSDLCWGLPRSVNVGICGLGFADPH